MVCWNCHGALSGEFLREIKEFMRRFKPEIILLMEPKISGETVDRICRKLGKNRWIRSESERLSSSVWCLWDEEEIEVKLTYAHIFFSRVTLKSVRGVVWEMTAIYASQMPTSDDNSMPNWMSYTSKHHGSY